MDDKQPHMDDKKDLSAEEQKILAFLQGKTLVPTIEIAKHMQPEGYRAKQVNPVLYELVKKKRVVRTAKPNGGDPKWSPV